MLQAIARNKARSFLLNEGVRVPREDIVTSCVFGGLAYLPVDQASSVLRRMLPDIVREGTVFEEVELWPRLDGCEPDGIIRCRTPGGRGLKVLVEAKWGSNPLKEDQLARQWDLFVDASGDNVHLLVAQNRTHVEERVLDSVQLGPSSGRILMTWQELATNLMHGSRSDATPETNRWALDVVRVLGTALQAPFTGISIPAFAVPDAGEAGVFYRDQIIGVHGFEIGAVPPVAFWNGEAPR